MLDPGPEWVQCTPLPSLRRGYGTAPIDSAFRAGLWARICRAASTSRELSLLGPEGFSISRNGSEATLPGFDLALPMALYCPRRNGRAPADVPADVGVVGGLRTGESGLCLAAVGPSTASSETWGMSWGDLEATLTQSVPRRWLTRREGIDSDWFDPLVRAVEALWDRAVSDVR